MQFYLHMVRTYWQQCILSAWKEKSIIWLTGVRRTGKTTLCKSLTPEGYFDCELPRIRRSLEDPEDFFMNLNTDKITFDEIHRLDNPSEVLKIAADHFPQIKILATGSSTLSASKKFKDTLTHRKRNLFLTPMNSIDAQDFGQTNLTHRLLHGGLPPFFLASEFPEKDYQEWLDSFWSKDVQELFKVEKKEAFLKFFELLGLQSGGLFQGQSFASPCGVSHTTISHYLHVLASLNVVYILRPFSNNASREIIAMPKVYFFDTGFICYLKGIHELHKEDQGLLWEHLVLNEALAFLNTSEIQFWRDKQKHELDFIIKKRGRAPIAIECKWQSKEFDPRNLSIFRQRYPQGTNLLVSADVIKIKPYKYKNLEVLQVPLSKLGDVLLKIK